MIVKTKTKRSYFYDLMFMFQDALSLDDFEMDSSAVVSSHTDSPSSMSSLPDAKLRRMARFVVSVKSQFEIRFSLSNRVATGLQRAKSSPGNVAVVRGTGCGDRQRQQKDLDS